MKANGGLWNTLFRQNPVKAKSVILDTRAGMVERPGSIKNAAAYALDLFKTNFHQASAR
jgi:hypothetical protein